MPFILRLLVNAAAIWAAIRLVPGITHVGSWGSLFGVALVFGVVNAIVRPLLLLFSLPLLVITLGLFTLVVNALLLWLTSSLSGSLGLGFTISGFWAAFFGALVISLVSLGLSILIAGK